MEFAVGMHQDQGKREYQQDAMSIKPFGSIGVLAILADGMGGYEGGEIASKLVSENFREFSIEGEDIGDSLKKYLLKGNEAIRNYKQEHSEVKSMGTTAIAFFMTDKSCQWVSVGDSPLYVIRNRSTIKRINENHSVAGLLDLQVKKGEISQEEALSSGQRHMLTSAISGDDIPQMDLSVSWTTRSDDIFILASDGIETISEDRIREIVLGHVTVATQENMQNACEALVQEVMSKGTKNQDNVTVVMLAKIEDDEPKTKIHYGAGIGFDKKKKLPLAIISGVIALIILVLVVLFLLSDDKDNESVVDINKTTKQAVSKPKEAIRPPAAEHEKVTKNNTAMDQSKTPAPTKKDNNATSKSNKIGDANKKLDAVKEQKEAQAVKKSVKSEQKVSKSSGETKEVPQEETRK